MVPFCNLFIELTFVKHVIYTAEKVHVGPM